jgi:hypothetical protein
MHEVYLIIVVILLCIICRYIYIYTNREGFYTEIKTHSQLNDIYENKYNLIGDALTATNKTGALGDNTQAIMGNVKSSMDSSGKIIQIIDNPYGLENTQSGLFKDIAKCEKVTTSSCSAFDDPSFSNTCGLCMDIGVNSKDNKTIGGLLLNEKDKRFARDSRRGGGIPDYNPTIGFCPSGMFVSNKEECLRVEKQIKCQKSSTFNSPEGCVQCYSDSSYSIVDTKYDQDLIRGAGSLYVIGLGVLEYQEVGQGSKRVVNLSKLREPYKITLLGGELTTVQLYLKKAIIPVPYNETTMYNVDDMIIFNRYIYTMVEGANAPGYAPDRQGDKLWNKEMLEADYVPPPPNYLAGYLSGDTAEESSFTFDLYRLILTDQISGRKPRAVGSMSIKSPGGKDDVETTKMGPIYGYKEMKLVMKSPFTFVDPYSQEASHCAASPFITKPESAKLLASDACYAKGSGPGKYNMACLQSTFLNNGCLEGGSGYPNSTLTMSQLMYDSNDNPLTIQDIAEYIYSQAVTTATGLDKNGKSLSIRKWSESSVFCSGVAITSPCDIGDKETGPLSVDCLEYLWDNKGENKKQGATYNITSAANSMFGIGKTTRFCTREGTLSPRDINGKDNIPAINFWKQQGGVNAVKRIMADIHYDANSELIPEDKKVNKIKQCYGVVPNSRKAFNSNYVSDNTVQTVINVKKNQVRRSGDNDSGSLDNVAYILIATSTFGDTWDPQNGNDFELSQLVVLDKDGNNISSSGTITSSPLDPAGQRDATAFISGKPAPSEYPDIFYLRTSGNGGRIPWIQLALDEPSSVSNVTLYTRNSTPYYFNHNVSGVVFHLLDENKKVIQKRAFPAQNNNKPIISMDFTSFTVGVGGNCKYVRITKIDSSKTNGMALQQISVFDKNGVNVSKNVNVKSMGRWGVPEMLVNGVGDGVFDSVAGSAEQYVELVLAAPTSISKVVIKGREDCCRERNLDYKVVIYDSKRVELFSQSLTSDVTQTITVTGAASIVKDTPAPASASTSDFAFADETPSSSSNSDSSFIKLGDFKLGIIDTQPCWNINKPEYSTDGWIFVSDTSDWRKIADGQRNETWAHIQLTAKDIYGTNVMNMVRQNADSLNISDRIGQQSPPYISYLIRHKTKKSSVVLNKCGYINDIQCRQGAIVGMYIGNNWWNNSDPKYKPYVVDMITGGSKKPIGTPLMGSDDVYELYYAITDGTSTPSIPPLTRDIPVPLSTRFGVGWNF